MFQDIKPGGGSGPGAGEGGRKEWIDKDVYQQEIREIRTLAELIANNSSRVRGVSIDGPATRVVDDVFSASRVGKLIVAQVSVALVGGIVPRGFAIEKFARAHLTTLYAKNVNDGIWPPDVGVGLLSLRSGSRYPALTLELIFDAGLKFRESSLQVTGVVNLAQLSRAEADLKLQDPNDKIHTNLVLLEQVARALHEQRRGYSQKEADGRNVKALKGGSSLIVDELNIAFNRCVAAYMCANKIPALYFNQINEREERRANGNVSGGRPNASLSPGRYETTSKGNVSYNAEHYCHASSPLRRFVDFVNQSNIVAFWQNEKPPYSEKDCAEIVLELSAHGVKRQEQKAFYFQRDILRSRVTELVRNYTLASLPELIASAVKLAPKPEVVSIIQKSSRSGELPPRSISQILLDPTDYAWQVVKQDVLNNLQLFPDKIAAVLQSVAQRKFLAHINCVEAGEAAGRSTVKLQLKKANGEIILESRATAFSVVDAKMTASIKLLNEMLLTPNGQASRELEKPKNLEQVSLDLRRLSEIFNELSQENSPLDRQALMELNRQIGVRKLASPIEEKLYVTLPRLGALNLVLLSLSVEGATLSSGVCYGLSRMDAKNRAAAQLLQQLERYHL